MKPMKEGRKPEYPEKTPGDELLRNFGQPCLPVPEPVFPIGRIAVI